MGDPTRSGCVDHARAISDTAAELLDTIIGNLGRLNAASRAVLLGELAGTLVNLARLRDDVQAVARAGADSTAN